MDFEPFPKMARLSRDIVITEKIDGTNAQVAISEDGGIRFGSRNRWVTPEDDNYGFARWGVANMAELMTLGPGRHYGEWWGRGIQRGYGLDEKRFSLFNSGRWTDDVRPACCHVVPVLYQGPFSQEVIEDKLNTLRRVGSFAAPGFGNAEGIIIYHTAARISFKKTLDGDQAKGRIE